MKRLLTALSLLFVSLSSNAQQDDSGCRLLIGDEWVTMGASSMQSCLKYAAAAATPGERQVAEFHTQSLSFKDGSYYTSRDQGRTWQRLNPSETEARISSLNVLQTGPVAVDTPGPSPKATTEPAQDKKPEKKPEKKKARAEPAADKALVTASAEPAATSMASAPVEAAAIDSTPRPQAPAPTTLAQSGYRAQGCQINISGNRTTIQTPSLETCGNAVIKRTVKPAAYGHGYWGGQYLIYSNQTLYTSPDGKNWRQITP